MGEIRLVLYVIILIFSLYNITSHYSKKKKIKKVAKTLKEDMSPTRVLTEAESKSLNTLHKTSAEAGSSVFVLTGLYSSEALQMKGSTVTTHYIGAFHIQWDNIFDQFIEMDKENTIEVVFPENDKGCLIISINDRYSAVKESDIRSQLDSENEGNLSSTPVNTGEALYHVLSRSANAEEKKYMAKDLRFIACMLVFAGLLLLTLSPVGIISILGIILIIPSLVLIFIKENPFGKIGFNENLVSVKGVLKLRKPHALNEYYIDRFSLLFPPKWEKIPVDREVKIEGYPLDKKSSSIRVLSINTGRSVQMDELKQPSRNFRRFILLAAFLVVNIIVLLNANGGAENVKRLINYFSTRNLQKTFTTFEEISDYKFKTGQEVSLLKQKVMPEFSLLDSGYVTSNGNVIIPEETRIDFTIDKVVERLEDLISLQLTEEMISMAALRSADNIEYSTFLIANYQLSNEKYISDFTEIFKDNSDFNALIKMSGYIFGEEESEETVYAEDVVEVMDNFFRTETTILNKKIGDALLKAVPHDNVIKINTDDYHEDLYSFRMRDLLSFKRNTTFLSDNSLKYANPLEAETTLEKLRDYMEMGNNPININGVLINVNTSDDGNTYFQINFDDDYSDLEPLYRISILLIFTVILLVISSAMIVLGRKNNETR